MLKSGEKTVDISPRFQAVPTPDVLLVVDLHTLNNPFFSLGPVLFLPHTLPKEKQHMYKDITLQSGGSSEKQKAK